MNIIRHGVCRRFIYFKLYIRFLLLGDWFSVLFWWNSLCSRAFCLMNYSARGFASGRMQIKSLMSVFGWKIAQLRDLKLIGIRLAFRVLQYLKIRSQKDKSSIETRLGSSWISFQRHSKHPQWQHLLEQIWIMPKLDQSSTKLHAHATKCHRTIKPTEMDTLSGSHDWAR